MVPHDVVSGILIEVPVKALLRFKSVSKEWCSIINHPYFINLHLHQSMKTNRHNLHVIVTDRFVGTSIISLNSDSVNLDNPRILSHPLKQPQKVASGCHYILVVGSSNGLVCLMNEISGETAFWNISTGDYRVLPYVRMKRKKAETVIHYLHGLGHDSINDDYKLLRIARVRVRTTHRRIVNKSVVYSLRTNTWRRVEEVHSNFIPNFNRPGTFVCGALHWISDEVVQYRSRRSITAFDVGTEKYRQLEPLDNMRLNPLVLGALGGCLCATETTSTGYRVNVWSMKDYGVKDSWTMLFSFRINTISWFSLRPLAYSKTQDKLLFESKFKNLSWHHLKDDEFNTYRQWEVRFNSTQICMESLVQLW